jgi:hypothetical protein
MDPDRAHDIACEAFAADGRVLALLDKHGSGLYSSLTSPSSETGGRWVELLLLGIGDSRFVDDPRGSAIVVARCEVDPESGAYAVTVEETA